MYSLIIGGVLCICSAYFGFIIKQKYSKTLVFCTNWVQFNSYCKQNILHLKKPIGIIINDFGIGKTNEFIELINSFVKNKDDFDEQVKNIGVLKGQNKALLMEYFQDLGALDWVSQLDKLEYYNKELEKLESWAKVNNKNNGTLAWKLGIIAGIAIMILLA